MIHSYMMLMEPASKVSVPFTVVMRTRSRVLERDLEPPLRHGALPVFIARMPDSVQVLVETTSTFAEPDNVFAAFMIVYKRNPVEFQVVAPLPP